MRNGILRVGFIVAAATAAVASATVVSPLQAVESVQGLVFLVPQIRCHVPPLGERSGPTGVGTLLAAIAQAPDDVGNYLDLARCHMLNGNTRLVEAEERLAEARTLIHAKRVAESGAGAPSAAAASPVLRAGATSPTPRKLKDVVPVYSMAARMDSISGVVFLEATIDPKGDVRATRVVGSIPSLDRSAQNAVRQWKYEPTIVDGRPVEVVKIVAVSFGTSSTSTTVMIDFARLYHAQGRYADAEDAVAEALAAVQGLRSGLPPPARPRLVDGSLADAGMPLKIFDVRPDFLAVALPDRVPDTIIIEFTVGTDGSVTNARVVQSARGLEQAALKSIRQWRFTPTIIKGVPTEVVLTETIRLTRS